MITRKLAVPLINEKILQQAEHCYMVTSAVSETGFDFVRSRIPPKCKIDLVMGLDRPVSPNVLRRILNNYSDRISVRIFTRNTLNANMYMFELPFRKSVAYIGSGGLTMDGLKDHEELFWKVTNPKEIESLLSWFTSFYEFGTPLSAQVVNSYEPVYYAMQKREVSSLREKEFAMTYASVNWDNIKFRNQFFQRDDFETMRNMENNAHVVHEKLRELRRDVEVELQRQSLFPVNDTLADAMASDDEVSFPPAVWISFSRSTSGFNPGFMRIDAGVTPSWFFVRLRISGGEGAREDRLKLLSHLAGEAFRQKWFAAVKALGSEYALEVAGRRKVVESFAKDTGLVDWMKSEDSHIYPVMLEKRFLPGDPKIRLDTMKSTLQEEVLRINGVLAASAD
jgi:hypothetical protein